MRVYLPAKFEVSPIIVTSFRQDVILHPPTSKKKNLKCPPRLGLLIEKKFCVKLLEIT